MKFFSTLALLFIALKLLGYITWAWLWVLAPLWMPLAFVLPIALVVIILTPEETAMQKYIRMQSKRK